MIGDRIIVERHHEKKATMALCKMPEVLKNKFVIAIAGISGCGKTEVAICLQKLLFEEGITSYLLSIDDYYKTCWVDRDKIREETDVIGQQEINWSKVNKIIRNFKKDEAKIYTQRLNRFTDQLEHTRINGKKIDVIICEGLYALYLKKIDLGVYIDATNEQTYKFRSKRKKEDPDDTFRHYVLKKEQTAVKQSKEKANLVISYETSSPIQNRAVS